MITGYEETKDVIHQPDIPCNSSHTSSSDAGGCDPIATEEHNSERNGQHRQQPGAGPFNGSKYRAGETERAQGIPDIMSNKAADTLANNSSCSSHSIISAVGFDIETTGIDDTDILTVACVWSPTVQIICFNGDDFTPILEILDKIDLIYTFNGVEFDLPRLAKHCGRSSIGTWARKTVDPHYLIRYSMGFGGCIRLNDLLISNGYEPKSGSGLQAIRFWNEGNRAALSSYCMDDARLTYELCKTRSITWGANWRIHLWESCVMRFAGV